MTRTKLNSHGHRVIVYDRENLLTWSDQQLRDTLHGLYVDDAERRAGLVGLRDSDYQSLRDLVVNQTRLQLIDEVQASANWS